MSDPILTALTDIKSSIADMKDDIGVVKLETGILNKFIFGNGVKGLVKTVDELNVALTKLNSTVESLQMVQKAVKDITAGGINEEQLKIHYKMLLAKTAGTWFAGISLLLAIILRILGAI